jgi:hypothetical protein
MASVYILVNKDMPGLIKIGHTSSAASERAKKLSQSTSVPSPFEVAYEIPCDQAKQLERTMHIQLAQYRRPRREFFECSVEYAISLLEHYSLDILNNHPWNQKAKELLQKIPNEEIEGIYPDQLYILQLMQWGLNHLPEFEEMKKPSIVPVNTTTVSDLINELNGLMLKTPKEAMEFLTETPWDPESEPYPEVWRFRGIQTAENGAEMLLTNLYERIRWWTAIPMD